MKNPEVICVTVVVCTYNRSELLALCLRSLELQTVDKNLFEVLIIDNNSTDDTASVARSYQESFPHFRLISEPKQGLSHARNRGWQEAEGEYVAYIDDDAKAHTDWISEMIRFLREHPEIKAFGGPYYRYSMEPLPEWFPEEYGTYTLGNRERYVEIPREWLNGTNMVFKKGLLALYRGFNPDLGMRGSQLGYGEETDLLRHLNENNHEVFYCPNMKVDHLVAPYKVSLFWLLHSAYRNGISWGTMQKSAGTIKKLLLIPYTALRGTFRFFSLGSMPLKRRIYYSFQNFFAACGAFRATGHTGSEKNID